MALETQNRLKITFANKDGKLVTGFYDHSLPLPRVGDKVTATDKTHSIYGVVDAITWSFDFQVKRAKSDNLNCATAIIFLNDIQITEFRQTYDNPATANANP